MPICTHEAFRWVCVHVCVFVCISSVFAAGCLFRSKMFPVSSVVLQLRGGDWYTSPTPSAPQNQVHSSLFFSPFPYDKLRGCGIESLPMGEGKKRRRKKTARCKAITVCSVSVLGFDELYFSLLPGPHFVVSFSPPSSGPGGSQRLGGCHPFHYECVAGLPHLLADFQYHGRQLVCGQVQLLLQWDVGGVLSCGCG